ncbi:DUF3021 domain-containing protein [Hornefia porci]|uniref:DUF3021 domain-containing protein n=1 Tax=Hornefia porci TaxID=2652292 RepID=UPI0009F8AB36|nr:DUF3021 domain-containing protein [Hornefia porci]
MLSVFFLAIVNSLIVGDGRFYACTPAFADTVGSEITAVILQTLLSGLVGIVFGASSVIWDIEDWSIAKQSGFFFAIAAAALMPAGYALNWMDRSARGIFGFFLIFAAVFVIIWFTMYLAWRHKIRKLNRDVEQKNRVRLMFADI